MIRLITAGGKNTAACAPTRQKRLLADAELDKVILREAASGNFYARRNADKPSNGCALLSDVIGRFKTRH